MKKKAIATKKSKTKPAMKRKLGKGLSSLLSKDEELASVIKSKIKTKLDQGNKDSKLHWSFPEFYDVDKSFDL